MVPGGALPEVCPALVEAPVPPLQAVDDQPGRLLRSLGLVAAVVSLAPAAGDALSRRDPHPRPAAEDAVVRVVAALAQGGLATGVETVEKMLVGMTQDKDWLPKEPGTGYMTLPYKTSPYMDNPVQRTTPYKDYPVQGLPRTMDIPVQWTSPYNGHPRTMHCTIEKIS